MKYYMNTGMLAAYQERWRELISLITNEKDKQERLCYQQELVLLEKKINTLISSDKDLTKQYRR